MTFSPGDTIAGKCDVEWTIGAGGMGIVLAARHRMLNQRVAIKLPTANLRNEPEAREIMREARACARLRSEHVVRVLDVDMLPDGSPFIVMEYLPGRSLAERLREEGPLPVRDAVDVIAQACDALEEAHALGIVHRDLKPSNLFEMRRFGGSCVVKILDFGVAKAPALAPGDGIFNTLGILGSPVYMAPEQVERAGDADAHADVWALGVTLFELLTGKPPFHGRTLSDLLEAIRAGSPPFRIALRVGAGEAREVRIALDVERPAEPPPTPPAPHTVVNRPAGYSTTFYIARGSP